MQSTDELVRGMPRNESGVVVGARFFRYWGPVCGYAVLIFYLSAQSHPEQALPSFFQLVNDKIVHAIEYAVLGGLCYRAFRWGTNGSWARQAIIHAIVLASLYGMSDELHQWFVPFRQSSWQDWMADVMGSTIGAMMIRWMVEPASTPSAGSKLHRS